MKTLRKVDLKQPTMDTFYELATDTFDTVCDLKIRLGGQYLPKCHFMDGQKYVCMDEMMKDIELQECIVYSFGIGSDWSFEEDIFDMGCKVFAYDPTINRPSNMSRNIMFKKKGVVGISNKNATYLTLKEVLRSNGHENSKISYMKLDIEGHELSGLPLWLKSGALDKVEQIAIEVHLEEPSQEKKTLEFLKTFQQLHLIGNYRIINWEANNCWKYLNKRHDYFAVSEIVLKKIDTENPCVQ